MLPKEGSGEGVVKLRIWTEFKRDDLIMLTLDNFIRLDIQRP
jgi:hypothetical protein